MPRSCSQTMKACTTPRSLLQVLNGEVKCSHNKKYYCWTIEHLVGGGTGMYLTKQASAWENSAGFMDFELQPVVTQSKVRAEKSEQPLTMGHSPLVEQLHEMFGAMEVHGAAPMKSPIRGLGLGTGQALTARSPSLPQPMALGCV